MPSKLQENRGLHSSVKDGLSSEELIYLRNIHTHNSGSVRKAAFQAAAKKQQAAGEVRTVIKETYPGSEKILNFTWTHKWSMEFIVDF